MTPAEEAAALLLPRAQEEIGLALADDIPEEDAEARAWARLVELVEEENRRRALGGEPSLATEERAGVARTLFNHLFRLGSIQELLEDEAVEEVVVNAARRGFVVRAGGAEEEFDPGFSSDEEVRSLLARVVARAGRRIDDASPVHHLRAWARRIRHAGRWSCYT